MIKPVREKYKEQIQDSLQDYQKRQALRRLKQEKHNKESLKYALQEREIKKGTYEGPPPRRLDGFYDTRIKNENKNKK